MPNIELIHDDCMNVMAKYPDNHFDLAICDPPYGISWSNKPASRSGISIHSKTLKKGFVKGNIYKSKDWDNIQPTQLYFDELFRVSKNQIIWGDNYIQFDQKNTSYGRIFWDKVNLGTTFSDGELAWCSLINTIKQVEYMWNGMMQGESINRGRIQQGNKKMNEVKIHPTQKPILIYKWILTNYANKGDKIIDTHGGSMSIAIACYDLGFDLTCCELDKDYYETAVKRFNNHKKQLTIF